MIKAYVETIQGDTARVLVGDEAVAVSVPLSQLPGGVKEGAMLNVKFSFDVAGSIRRQARASGEGRE